MNISALNSPIPLSPHPSTILTHSPLLHPLPDTYPDPLTPHPTPHTHLIDRVRTQLSSQFATTGSLIAGSSEKGRLRLRLRNTTALRHLYIMYAFNSVVYHSQHFSLNQVIKNVLYSFIPLDCSIMK